MQRAMFLPLIDDHRNGYSKFTAVAAAADAMSTVWHASLTVDHRHHTKSRGHRILLECLDSGVEPRMAVTSDKCIKSSVPRFAQVVCVVSCRRFKRVQTDSVHGGAGRTLSQPSVVQEGPVDGWNAVLIAGIERTTRFTDRHKPEMNFWNREQTERMEMTADGNETYEKNSCMFFAIGSIQNTVHQPLGLVHCLTSDRTFSASVSPCLMATWMSLQWNSFSEQLNPEII